MYLKKKKKKEGRCCDTVYHVQYRIFVAFKTKYLKLDTGMKLHLLLELQLSKE